MKIGKLIVISLNNRMDFRRIVRSGVNDHVMDKLRMTHYKFFDVLNVNVYSTMVRSFTKSNSENRQSYYYD